MKTNRTIRRSFTRSGAILLASLLAGGCSGSVTMPWDSALLDPGRINTREPLEIPPDLNTLPEGPRPDSSPTIGWIDPNEAGNERPSVNVPLYLPEKQDEKPLSRNEKEELPDWMESPARAQ